MSWIENLEICFEHNDIISIDADAMVCPVSLQLNEYGKISHKIYEISHPNFKNDLYEIRKKLPDEHLILGQAISINCKPEYHIGNFKILIFVALWDYQSEYNFNLFYKSYINSLREAFHRNIKSIALPIMAYDCNLALCGKAIVKVIKDLDHLKKSSEFSLEKIYFTSNNMGHIEFLERHVEPKLY